MLKTCIMRQLCQSPKQIGGVVGIWMVVAAFTTPTSGWSQSAVWQPQNATSGSIYYTGGNVGIGTTSPDQKVTVQGGSMVVRDSTGANGGQTLYSANTTTSGVNYGAVLYAVGSGAAANTAGYFSSAGGTFNYGVRIVNPPAGPNNWTIYADAGAPSYFAGNVGIGTSNPQSKLAVAGVITAKEVVVTSTGWSDYVFAPSYRLRSLPEVEAYIASHHHLPEIPSAEEVQESGVTMGDMQAKLLAKIEELTLHMIRQEKENKELRQRMAELEHAVRPGDVNSVH